MMRRGHHKRDVRFAGDDDDEDFEHAYFTYRPLSKLPTPPPTFNTRSCADQTVGDDDDDCLSPKLRGPAIHLVNLIPSSASLATASVPFVQAMLARAERPIETVALAVCILDSLDTKFARAWRLSCPLNIDDPAPSCSPTATATATATSASASASPSSSSLSSSSSSSKRHSLPSDPRRAAPPHRQLHIDSVRPEIIILAALVIAAKFTEDLQEPPQFYRVAWGRGMWSNEQLNITERCIMKSLDYRIMPLCDEDLLADAMVDMQLAARQEQSGSRWNLPREPTPPDSVAGSESEYVPSHAHSKTTLGLGVGFSDPAVVRER